MKRATTDASIRKFHLWASLPDELWQELSCVMSWHEFGAGETVFPAHQTNDCLCVLWSGRARVFARSADPAHAALLRTMESGAVFGVHCVFNADMPPQSSIVAEKPCQVLLIPSSCWEKILASHPQTMASYIRFLTQRIEFLNRKVQYLTAGSAERRLALYLLSQIPQDGVATRLTISAVSLADLLDLGRASLYRAMDKLTSDGFLERDGHDYTLHHRDDMLAHYS